VPRRSILKVVKVNYTPAAPWMVRVPSRLQRVEGARKKFFEKESVAKAYIERLAKQLPASPIGAILASCWSLAVVAATCG
jgi:hypothetical protein